MAVVWWSLCDSGCPLWGRRDEGKWQSRASERKQMLVAQKVMGRDQPETGPEEQGGPSQYPVLRPALLKICKG